MNFKLILLTLLSLAALLRAELLFKIHDGKAWQEIDQAAWEKLPRGEITAKARDGKDHRYSGVPLLEILKLMAAPAGETLRGPEMNRVLLVTAGDGYQIAFSLAELDPAFRKQNIIVADKVDDQPLSDFEGRRMIVSGDDLKHSRWIRRITAFILTRPEVPPP